MSNDPIRNLSLRQGRSQSHARLNDERTIGEIERDVADAEFQGVFNANGDVITIGNAEIGSPSHINTTENLLAVFGNPDYAPNFSEIARQIEREVSRVFVPIPPPPRDYLDDLRDEAVNIIPMQRDEEQANKKLSGSKLSSLKPMRDKLKKAKQARMRTVESYLCDQCDSAIRHPQDGYIIQGNIYVADPTCRGGLIGNNFPDPSNDGTIKVDAIRETVLCKECFIKALDIIREVPKGSAAYEKKYASTNRFARPLVQNSHGGSEPEVPF